MSDIRMLAWGGAAAHQRTAYSIAGSAGDEVPLVLVHGVGMSWRFWEPQIAHFSGRRTVVAYDMLGHGQSSLPPEDVSIDLYAEQLLALVDGLGMERIDLAGHSMGALVSLEFALTHPERVRRVAAVNAVYCRAPAQRAAVESRAALLAASANPLATVEETIARWFGAPPPEELAGAALLSRQMLGQADPQGYARTYRLFATSDDRHVKQLGNLAMPALFLTGEFDPNSTPDMSRAMAAAAPVGRCEVVPDQRHMMTMVAPAEINRRLEAFFG